MKKKAKIVILGSGVVGLSAAHELAESDFDVAVYEARKIPGGKARSIPVPGSSQNGKKELPREYGFRFFPGFYQHINDTMKRIPYKDNPQGVFLSHSAGMMIFAINKDRLGKISFTYNNS